MIKVRFDKNTLGEVSPSRNSTSNKIQVRLYETKPMFQVMPELRLVSLDMSLNYTYTRLAEEMLVSASIVADLKNFGSSY